jgi:hypothetical protein
VARPTGENGTPLPRSLKTVAAVRREAVALYRQVKGGNVEPQLAGRLGYLLNLLVTISRDREFEARIEALEQALAEAQPHRAARRNGHDAYARP